mmetsp:Transcript_25245/g.75360  ORF Transcript_25245/g.75360 Transcript_25245/m.75360 type:complete len:233 (+) Transcript_25245:115-813(+)
MQTSNRTRTNAGMRACTRARARPPYSGRRVQLLLVAHAVHGDVTRPADALAAHALRRATRTAAAQDLAAAPGGRDGVARALVGAVANLAHALAARARGGTAVGLATQHGAGAAGVPGALARLGDASAGHSTPASGTEALVARRAPALGGPARLGAALDLARAVGVLRALRAVAVHGNLAFGLCLHAQAADLQRVQRAGAVARSALIARQEGRGVQASWLRSRRRGKDHDKQD